MLQKENNVKEKHTSSVIYFYNLVQMKKDIFIHIKLMVIASKDGWGFCSKFLWRSFLLSNKENNK